MNAHRITHTCPARVRGEHLTAANDVCCNYNCDQGRKCPHRPQPTVDALRGFVPMLRAAVRRITVCDLLAVAVAITAIGGTWYRG